MNKPSPVDSLIGPMAGELAAALANHLKMADGGQGPALEGESFDHGFIKEYKVGQHILERLELYSASGEQAKVFVTDAERMPDFLSTRIQPDDERIERLIDAFVGVACEFGQLPDSRDWFVSPSAWQAAMTHLALAGYAQQDGDQFRWTEKIAPIMHSQGLWNDEGCGSACKKDPVSGVIGV